ncbi:hypothetical protein [Maribellus mangrovi]|uniref:hypothetical protein n=1 Tax=Maribellus mangrovi TaxID=3133146 RepID=UPI0030EEF105
MKKAFCLITFLIIVSTLYSQTTSGQFTTDYYLQKSKKQYKTGGILLGVGTTMAVVGAIGFDKNFVMFEKGGNETKADVYGFIMLAGLIMDIVSIPILISSAVNKKKALSLVINNQLIYDPNGYLLAFQKQSIPSLTLILKF